MDYEKKIFFHIILFFLYFPRWVFQSTRAARINESVAARIIFKEFIHRYCESASCKRGIEQHLLCI